MTEAERIHLDYVEEYRGVLLNHGHTVGEGTPVVFTDKSPFFMLFGPESVKEARRVVDFDLASYKPSQE